MFFSLWFPAYWGVTDHQQAVCLSQSWHAVCYSCLKQCRGGNGRQRHSHPTSHPLSLEKSLEEPTDKLSQRNEQ